VTDAYERLGLDEALHGEMTYADEALRGPRSA